MAIIKNVKIFYAKLDPKRPNAKLNKDNPTWELQCRTNSVDQKKEWESLGMKVRLLVGKEGSENEGEPILDEEGKKQWRLNLKKRSLNKKREPQSPVEVLDGKNKPVDPRSVGDGSIANIRIMQYEYKKADDTIGIAPVLMAIQLVRHVVRKAKPMEEFGETETEVVVPESTEDNEDPPFDNDDSKEEEVVVKKVKVPVMKRPDTDF